MKMRRYRSDVDDLDLDLIEWGWRFDDRDTALEIAKSLPGFDEWRGEMTNETD